MSKSYKKAVYKDKGDSEYNKRIRRVVKNDVKKIKHLTDIDNYEIRNGKEIVNDYDVSDYKFDYENSSYWSENLDQKELNKLRRK